MSELFRDSDHVGSIGDQDRSYSVPDGKRLSKREKSLDMSHLRGRFQPETLIGYLACLAGLIAKPVPVKAAELIEVFSWNKIGKEPITVKTLL